MAHKKVIEELECQELTCDWCEKKCVDRPYFQEGANEVRTCSLCDREACHDHGKQGKSVGRRWICNECWKLGEVFTDRMMKAQLAMITAENKAMDDWQNLVNKEIRGL